MLMKIRTPMHSTDGIRMVEIGLDAVKLQEPTIIAIDGSTSNTGVSLVRESDGALIATMAFKHENDKESAVKYKVLLKRVLHKLLLNNRCIEWVFYEEPFLGYVGAAKNLLMLRTLVEELIYEQEPELDYIKFHEINNMKWKKLFLYPDKVPVGTECQKAAVRKKLVVELPFLECITQDEVDATCIAYVAATSIRKGLEIELQTKKKTRPFKYSVKFIGADSDDDMLMELGDSIDELGMVASNGVQLVSLSGRENWDKKIYETMGQEDKLLLLKFSSNKFGNIILENRLGHLTQYEYIYALVWRTRRKR